MYRGTTPTLYLELETEIDLSDVTELFVTIKSPRVEINKSLSDVQIDNDLKVITVSFTQEETLRLFKGNADVQVRFKLSNGLAYASTIESVEVERILKDGVI